MKIAVLGAGVVGVTTAYYLGLKGYRVTLVDADKSVAGKTSYANGGQLSYSYTDSLASPSILPKLHKLVRGKDPAFTIKPSADPKLIKWGMRFLRNCTREREQFNTRAVLRLAMHSRGELHRMLERHEIRFEHRMAGKLHIYTDVYAFESACIKAQLKQSWGCPQEILDSNACLQKEPALKHFSDDIAGGIYSPLDEVGDAQAFSVALAEICVKEFGCELMLETAITGIRTANNRVIGVDTRNGPVNADAYVFALGPQSPLFARILGIDLPIYPLKGYSITVPAGPEAPEVSITDTQNKVVFCTLGNKLRIAGIAELVGYSDSIEASRIEQLIEIGRKRLPLAGDYDTILHQWSGLRPLTPQSAPLLGKSGLGNLYLNTGHGMLGWTLACGSASILATIVEGTSEPPIDLSGLTVN
ncbi:MAG: D-amino acid dehydrogenase [Oceanospirillaceae bacterium]|nr:D-amino acid dehydrogenase [Oceanospirillaceae bacterium]